MPPKLAAVKTDEEVRDEIVAELDEAELDEAELKSAATTTPARYSNLIRDGIAGFAKNADHYRQKKIQNLAARESLLQQLSENMHDGLQIDGMIAALEVACVALPGKVAAE